MKKFAEIREEIKAVRNRMADISKEMEEINDKESSLVMADSFKERLALCKEYADQLKKFDERFAALALEEENAKLAVAILSNNAQIALYHEVLPEIISVLMKYKGKPYGEKTREKIRMEVEEKTGCGFWLDCSRYHQQVHFYKSGAHDRSDDVVVCTNLQNGEYKPILSDNKIQEVTFEDFHLCYINSNYVDNVAENIEQLRKLRSEAVQKKKELEAICSQYNSLCAGSMKNITARENIYERMF